jgi:hypothetical protein
VPSQSLADACPCLTTSAQRPSMICSLCHDPLVAPRPPTGLGLTRPPGDSEQVWPSPSDEISSSYKTNFECALISVHERWSMHEVGLHLGKPLAAFIMHPNSSPSQARFNPDELNLRPVRTGLPEKHHPCSLGLEHRNFVVRVF